MANDLTSRRTHDPNGQYWTACCLLDTAATLELVPVATIIKPLGITIGTAQGTALLGKVSITDGADVVVAAFGVGYSASSIKIPLSQIPYMAGLKVVVNAIAGTGAHIASTLSFKYIGGTAPVVD